MAWEGAFAELARLAVESVAEWCSIEIVEESSLETVALAHRRTDVDLDAVAAAFLGLDVAELHSAPEVVDVADSTSSRLASLASIGLRSALVTPLAARGRILGRLILATGERPGYDDRDAVFAAELARRAALALDTARLYDAAQLARHEAALAARDAERLQEVTAGLAAAATTAEIADVIINQGIPALSATTGILGVLDGADELRFVRSIGYGDVFPDSLSLDAPWPITAAVRERTLIELRDVPERRVQYAVPEHVWTASGKGTLVAVPLVVRGRALGALGFTREDAAPLTPRERTLVETLARQAAQALERAQLYEADQKARVRAEGLQRVASAIATAATMGDVADAVASEALTVLEAAGVTVILTEDESPTRARVLASRGSVASHAHGEPTLDVGAGTLTAEAIRADTALYAGSLEELRARWPLSAAVAERLGLNTSASIPLHVGTRRGALSIVMAEPKRFLPEERTFVDLLARSCEQGLIRASLYEAERHARARAQLLHGLAAALSGALEPADVGRVFLDHALDFVQAGSGALMLAQRPGELAAAAIGGSGTTRSRWLERIPVEGGYAVAAAYRDGRPVAARTRAELEREFPQTARRFGPLLHAICAQPIVVGGVTAGAFGLAFEDERELAPDDERLLATMAALCGQAIERARLYESEHHIALRLQRALLPEHVARHPGVQIAARYVSGMTTMEVGGDWYDTFSFADGRIGLAVGDVVGHGIEAAASMGRLRSALAALAPEAEGPADLLTRLDGFAAGPGDVDFATASYAILEPTTGRLRYASAAHPPILVVEPSGDTRWLEGGRSGPLLGAVDEVRGEATVDLEPGSLVLLYSDGLVERRGELLTDGLARLEQAARELRDASVEEVCDGLLESLRVDSELGDDIVLVGIRLLPLTARGFRHVFPARPEELRRVRAAARRWLAEHDVPEPVAQDLVLALGEACANAVEHAYVDAAPRRADVEVAIEERAGELVLTVRDAGRWRTPESRDDRGMGSTIMRALSDWLSFEQREDGTTVTMRFRIRAEVPA